MIPHEHCPLGCWHPQPFSLLVACGVSVVDVAYCGRCWHEERVYTPMVPCTPAVCPDAAAAGEPQPSEPLEFETQPTNGKNHANR